MTEKLKIIRSRLEEIKERELETQHNLGCWNCEACEAEGTISVCNELIKIFEE